MTPPPSPLLSSLSPPVARPDARASRWSSFIARLRGSTWLAVGARLGAVVVALVVLGWIGRSAAAGPTSAMSVAATDRDASTPALPTIVPVDAGPPLVATGAALASTANAPAAAPATASTSGAPTGSHGRATPETPVYLNQASVDELRRLPGVGPKRAEAILVLRQRLGRFQRVEDLLRVKGVGRGAVKKWRPLVRLDAPAPPDAGSS
jgi:competence protein ComEA